MNWKLATDVLIVLILFAFGPPENRQFLFRSEPDLLYGEMIIYKTTSDSISLARNAAGEGARFAGPQPTRVWWRTATDDDSYLEGAPKQIHGDTLAIIERTHVSGKDSSLVHFGDSRPRPPQGLRVITRGEEFHDFAWVCLFVTLAALLSFAICDYSWRCGSPLRDILGETERPS
jgi:hypothetical protein